jgi:hypothetical protein
MPDHQWLLMSRYGGQDASTAQFYKNGIAWLANDTDLGIKVVTYNSHSGDNFEVFSRNLGFILCGV